MLTLVKFFATWCKPCKLATAMVEEIKSDIEDYVLFTDVDIDDNPQLKIEHHIRSIPTFILFRDGFELQRMIGCDSAETLKDWIDSFKELPEAEVVDEPGNIQSDLLQE